MRFLLYLKDQDQGCDYTIGCGVKIVDFTAENLDEAMNRTTEEIAEIFDGDWNKLEKARLYRVEEVWNI